MRQFSRMHPAIIFCYFIGSMAIVMLFLHPIFLIIELMLLILIQVVYDLGQSLRKWLFIMLTTGVMILILNPLFNERGRNVLFEIGDHRVTLEAVLYGGMAAMSIIGIMLLFIFYNEIMTPNKLLFLFSKLLPQFAVLLMLTLRFIPLMRRRVEEISAVQMSKGISVNQGKWKERISKGMLYIQILLTFSLEEAIQTADSMKARAYGGDNRTTYEFFTFKRSDIVSIIFLMAIISAGVYGRITGYGLLTIYPVMGTMTLASEEVIMLFLNCLFLGFPLLLEGGEQLKWRLLN